MVKKARPRRTTKTRKKPRGRRERERSERLGGGRGKKRREKSRDERGQVDGRRKNGRTKEIVEGTPPYPLSSTPEDDISRISYFMRLVRIFFSPLR